MMEIIFNPEKSTWRMIHEILNVAREAGKEEPIAKHLVGAKFELRFPGITVSNESYSTADDQLGRKGDLVPDRCMADNKTKYRIDHSRSDCS